MRSIEEFKDDADFFSEIMPVVIRCNDESWKEYFENYVLMDALTISREDLYGTNYTSRSYYTPQWLKEAAARNKLVLIHLDRIPIRSDDPTILCQFDFSHLIRDKDEDDAYRELNTGSDIFVPRELKVFIVIPRNYLLAPFFKERCVEMIIEDNGN